MKRSSAAATKPPERKPLAVSDMALANARRSAQPKEYPNPFAIGSHPPGVAPKGGMAMDDASTFGGVGAWGWGAIQGIGYEGQAFLGYPILAELAQRPEHRKIVDIIATEMTRRWIKIQAKGDDDKTEQIAELEDAFDTFRVRDRFRECVEHDGYFGRGHIYIDTGASDDPGELKTSIGSGRDKTSAAKITKKSIKGFRCIEPMWVYPTGYNTTQPWKPDWYKPRSWLVMSTEFHSTRLLTLIGREVPDMLKPAYFFGGLSMTQIAKPYVDNWLRTRQSTSDAIYRFSLDILKTDMASALNSDGGEGLRRRIALMQMLRDVNSSFVIDKDREDYATVAKPLGTLDHLQAQAQEQMASIAGIPLVKLLGITPSGLNASSDGEVRVFYDHIHAYQERLFSIPLDTVFAMLQIHLWGKVDPDLTYKFEPLWTLDEKEQAEVNEIQARTDATYHEAGILLTSEIRKRISGDEESPYDGLDVDAVPDEPPGAEGALGGSEGGEECNASPYVPAGQQGPLPRHAAHDAEFSEEDHPRGEGGKFSGGVSVSSSYDDGDRDNTHADVHGVFADPREAVAATSAHEGATTQSAKVHGAGDTAPAHLSMVSEPTVHGSLVHHAHVDHAAAVAHAEELSRAHWENGAGELRDGVEGAEARQARKMWNASRPAEHHVDRDLAFAKGTPELESEFESFLDKNFPNDVPLPYPGLVKANKYFSDDIAYRMGNNPQGRSGVFNVTRHPVIS